MAWRPESGFVAVSEAARGDGSRAGGTGGLAPIRYKHCVPLFSVGMAQGDDQAVNKSLTELNELA
jgi:hypothetical protein